MRPPHGQLRDAILKVASFTGCPDGNRWNQAENANLQPPQLAPPPDGQRWPFAAHAMLVVHRDEAGQVLSVKDMWLDQVAFSFIYLRNEVACPRLGDPHGAHDGPGLHTGEPSQHLNASMLTTGKAVNPARGYQGPGTELNDRCKQFSRVCSVFFPPIQLCHWYLPYRNCIDHLASQELALTADILRSSVGWSLLIDGSNKGSFHADATLFVQPLLNCVVYIVTRARSKGELLLFRDCNEMGEIQLRCLGMVFLRMKELKARLCVHSACECCYTSLLLVCDDAGMRPFGVAA
ncbi:hypothetical protein M569_14572, partial [Genlisea aurea]